MNIQPKFKTGDWVRWEGTKMRVSGHSYGVGAGFNGPTHFYLLAREDMKNPSVFAAPEEWIQEIDPLIDAIETARHESNPKI